MNASLCSTSSAYPAARHPRSSTPHASELLTIGTIVSGTGQASCRAHEVLDVIHEIVPYAAAKISHYDPLQGRHHTVANHGYPETVEHYLDDGFIERDELYRLMRSDGSAPLRWADTPFNYRQSESAREIFIPAGFDEGFSVCLYSPDGRYTGTLHISVDDRVAVDDSVMHAAVWMQRLLSPLADRIASSSSLTEAISPESTAILVNRDGRAYPVRQGPRSVPEAVYEPLIAMISRRWTGLSDRRVGRWLWRHDGGSWLELQIVAVAEGLLVMLCEAVPPHSLTYRELQVIAAVARGDTNGRIATELQISPLTVAKHLENVLDKTRVASRTELSTRAGEEGFLLFG